MEYPHERAGVMKTVVAIVRTSCVEGIVKSLEDAGIKSVTISQIKGIGEQVEVFKPYTIHSKIEMIVPDEKAEEVTDVIMECAHTGLAGDGIIAVYPMDYMIKIRTRERLE
jgi:nitrogen regulatory protein P-II 1